MNNLVIHKDWVLYLHWNGKVLAVIKVGNATSVGDFTEIHVINKLYFKEAIDSLEEER